MDALKEWATVVKALEQGKQTVILRKGGILETASGFNIESKKFFLFPTWEHQETKYVKPKFHEFLTEVLDKKPNADHNKISSYAEVLYEKDVNSSNVIKNLSSFHVWSDSYIQERRNWMPEKPMKTIFLRTVKIPEFDLPLQPEFSGCKSWIELNSKFQEGKSSLRDDEIDEKLQEFKEIVK
ncbi:MAG: DUF1802 family protein [Candidatus Nitrosopelagicus sp.]|nr:DUF1802 family protein [Candidatus Nitrosopelagicus sp.]